ncbi:hypothetical protein D1AOALGA4SA_10616 [Olavius algarvensis Delta 1 endosymbiont]|nr:hypothetical protein D1AOALGA4SA_10616 [Olavius algarvensis Delta 1 endosymbiont]
MSFRFINSQQSASSRIHNSIKFQNSSTKLQTNLNSKYSMTKND